MPRNLAAAWAIAGTAVAIAVIVVVGATAGLFGADNPAAAGEIIVTEQSVDMSAPVTLPTRAPQGIDTASLAAASVLDDGTAATVIYVDEPAIRYEDDGRYEDDDHERAEHRGGYDDDDEHEDDDD